MVILTIRDVSRDGGIGVQQWAELPKALLVAHCDVGRRMIESFAECFDDQCDATEVRR
jgi:hypothetical protein